MRVRQVRIHVLRALDAVEDQHDLAVRCDPIAIDHRGHRPGTELERCKARRSNRAWRYERRDLGDRGTHRTKIDSRASRIAQRHLSPQRSPAPGPRALTPETATSSRRGPGCDEGCRQRGECEHAEPPHQPAVRPHFWAQELHQKRNTQPRLVGATLQPSAPRVFPANSSLRSSVGLRESQPP